MNGVWVYRPAQLIIRSWTSSKNEYFILLAGEGWQMGFESIDQPGWSSEVNIIQKEAFHLFGWRGVVDGVWVHWPAWPTSEVEHNPQSSISFYWLERAGRWGLSPLTSPADHQKLNIIKKWAFHFLGGEGWWMRFKSIDQSGQHQMLNVIQKWAFHFFGWREVEYGVWVHRPAQPIIRSWT